jgi:mercuric reductase
VRGSRQGSLEKVPGVQSALVSYPKGTAQLAIEAGTSSDALTTAVAGLGYEATLADAPPTDNRAGLLDKMRGWIGAADKPVATNARCRSSSLVAVEPRWRQR